MTGGVALIIVLAGGGAILAYFVVTTERDIRNAASRARAAISDRVERNDAAPRSIAPPRVAATAVSQGPSAAFGWNVVVIVVGALVGAIGLINGLLADPVQSALQQTVSALWVLQGLVGLLIAAVGVAGLSNVHTLERAAARPSPPDGSHAR